jgi:large subunit ribosomal protein L15
MDLSNLKPPAGSRHRQKRLGRGESSGLGKTSGRGHKGQGSRSGSGVPMGFEGGQNPLLRRLPKFGFTKPNREKREVISLTELNSFKDGATVDVQSLKDLKLISKKFEGRVKILATGKLERKLTVKMHHISAGAKKAIETAGGTVEEIVVVKNVSKSGKLLPKTTSKN